MHRYQDLVRLHRERRALPADHAPSVHAIARSLNMSPNTERRARAVLDAAGLLDSSLDHLPSLDEICALFPVTATVPPPNETSSVAKHLALIDELQRKGNGPLAIHGVLLDQHGDEVAGKLSAVKRACLALRRAAGPLAEDVAIPVITGPGEVAQVDFGEVGRLRDPATGEVRRAWVFIMVLGFSRHFFAKVVFDQRVSTWLQLHIEAFEFFGGIPHTVVPDNLKAAVLRAAFRADAVSALNRSYRDLARMYGFKIDPAPPRAPKKKGKVERAVRYVKSSFFKVREDCGGFSDIDHANNALARWNVETAGLRKHGTTGRRPLEHFEEERATLLRLPTVRFEPTVWHRCVVQKTAHVFFDEQFWSAPWRFLGATVMVQATSESVTLYVNDERVAQHSRRQPGPWHTHEAHLPEGRRELRHRSPSWWISEADALGDDVGALVRATFKADEVQQPFRRVAAMLKLLRSVPPERANRASERVLRFGNLRVDGLRTVLNNGLDSQPLAPRVGGDIVVCSMTYARPPSAFANAGVRS